MDPGFVPQILALELGGSASLEEEVTGARNDRNVDIRGGLCEDAVEASREVWRAIVGWDADAHGRCHVGRGPAERGEQRLSQGCMVDVSAKDRGERRSGGALVPPWSTS